MVKPLLDIHCIEDPLCDYPGALKVPMKDGTIQTYVLENKTDYQFKKVMDSLKKLTVGYQYRGEHKKSRIHRGKL